MTLFHLQRLGNTATNEIGWWGGKDLEESGSD